jgi:hypothetical protein
MSAEIVNLRKARKVKDRAEKDRRAAENRVLHGRSKADREREAVDKARIRRELDGAKREPGDSNGET